MATKQTRGKKTRAERRQEELDNRRNAQRLEKQRNLKTAKEEAVLESTGSFKTGWVASLVAALIILYAIGPFGILNSALPMAGDQVTHNWWLTEYRDRLFALDGVFGWTNDLSLGYLFGFFYFPLPPLIFSALSLLLPDAVAIKTMVAISLMLIPLGAFRVATGLRIAKPAAALVPLLSLAAVFSNQPQFVGGTLYATLTGEFSYAYGLSFSLLTIGEVLRLPRKEGSWWRTGLFLAAGVLSHVLAVLPAVVVSLWVLLRYRKEITTPVVASILALATALSIWWVMPSFLAANEALGDGHKRVTELFTWLFHKEALPLVLAGLSGLILGLVRKRPGSKVLAGLVLAGPVVLLLMPGSFMWNVRIMPWYYTSLSICVAYLFEPVLINMASKKKTLLRATPAFALVAGLLLALGLPNNFLLAKTIRDSQYGGKSLSGTKYLDILIERLDQLPPGRVMVAVPERWAGALAARDWVTALPLYTDGKLTSAISLYYEASRSTPGIEYTHSYVSDQAHTSLSWLKYQSPEKGFETGVRSMRLLGIKYYVVGDQKMFNLASKSPGLSFIASTGTDSKQDAHQWGIFEVKDVDLVEPIRTPIAIAEPLPSERAWASAAANWLDVYDPTGDGPLVLESGPEYFDGSKKFDPMTVSNVKISDTKIEFDVSRTNVPVLVKVSYSKHWVADGAAGPFRSAPNFMVVVPNSPHVVINFSTPFPAKISIYVSLLIFFLLSVYRIRTHKASKSKGDSNK